MTVIDYLGELANLRTSSARHRPRAPTGEGKLADIAAKEWARADELADGVLRTAQPSLATCCGAISRLLWEDAISLAYVKKSPDTRIPQLLAGALDHHRRLFNTPWARQFGMKPLGKDESAFLRQRSNAEHEAMTVFRSREALPVDLFALLPPLKRRAEDVKSVDQYAAYMIKSAGAVHFGLVALFDPEGTPESRLQSSVAMAVGSYVYILGWVTDTLGLQEAAVEFSVSLRNLVASVAPKP